MNALDYFYDDAVCTAETIEEMNELLSRKAPQPPKGELSNLGEQRN